MSLRTNRVWCAVYFQQIDGIKVSLWVIVLWNGVTRHTKSHARTHTQIHTARSETLENRCTFSRQVGHSFLKNLRDKMRAWVNSPTSSWMGQNILGNNMGHRRSLTVSTSWCTDHRIDEDTPGWFVFLKWYWGKLHTSYYPEVHWMEASFRYHHPVVCVACDAARNQATRKHS